VKSANRFAVAALVLIAVLFAASIFGKYRDCRINGSNDKCLRLGPLFSVPPNSR
jgi:hypothetical protein